MTARLRTPFGLKRVVSLLAVALALAAPASQAVAAKKTVAAKKSAPAASSTRKVASSSSKAPRAKVAQAKDSRESRKAVASHDKGKHKNTQVAAARGARALRAAAVAAPVAAAAVARPSFGQMAGLHLANDPLDLKSSVALVVDQDTNEVLLSKNDDAVLPIASLTKLMTGLIVSEARLPMDELITITEEDVDTVKGSRSRLTVGTTLSRGELLLLALMSSENRAAHALGRTYPGGMQTFVRRMNAKAQQLGMTQTHYVEPTGLSSSNQSSAHDLAALVKVAHTDPLLRQFSTSPSHEVDVGHKTLQFNNTNGLVKSPNWDIGLQKTGYISEAGRCLVMQAEVAGRKLIMVFLDSAGRFSRIGDAERVRSWVEGATRPRG